MHNSSTNEIVEIKNRTNVYTLLTNITAVHRIFHFTDNEMNDHDDTAVILYS